MAPTVSRWTAEQTETRRVAALLGGPSVLKGEINDALQAHELLLRGLPSSAMDHLVSKLAVLARDHALERAIGMSIRTVQRRRKTAGEPLSREQSGRTWKFAEILARAITVFGTQHQAEEWLERPALGLDGHRPIDLLATTAGAEVVETFLKRLEFGVYV